VIFLKVEFESGIIAHKQLQNFQQKYARKQWSTKNMLKQENSRKQGRSRLNQK
jgi:hypothetical protein